MGNIRQLNLQRAKTLFFSFTENKKNFCFAIPVCIRTEFNLRNHKSNYITQSLLPFTLRVVSTRIFKEDLTFNVEPKNKKMASRIRINFHSDSEAMINKQINMELYASYVYMAMACYFDRDDVALKGFVKRSARTLRK